LDARNTTAAISKGLLEDLLGLMAYPSEHEQGHTVHCAFSGSDSQRQIMTQWVMSSFAKTFV